MSIYSDMIATGVRVDNHESDLYVPVLPETRAIVARYQFRDSVHAFVNQIDGRLWYDIPFAYLPWWEKRAPQ